MTSADACIDLQACTQRKFQPERQDLSCLYVAHHELESALVFIIIYLSHNFNWLLASLTSLLQAMTAAGVDPKAVLPCKLFFQSRSSSMLGGQRFTHLFLILNATA